MQINIPQMGMGGIQTYLIFNKNQYLPHFAAIFLFHQQKEQIIYDYCAEYIKFAKENNIFINLATPTWRASKDYIQKLGLTIQQMTSYHQKAVKLLKKLKEDFKYQKVNIIGMLGPRGDGYKIGKKMKIQQASQYHQYQVNIFKQLNINNIIIPTQYKQEAIGIIQLCKNNKMKIVVSFTVQTDGKLSDGSDYIETIKQIDELTESYTDYFMINCSHPDHMKSIFMSSQNQISKKRIK